MFCGLQNFTWTFIFGWTYLLTFLERKQHAAVGDLWQLCRQGLLGKVVQLGTYFIFWSRCCLAQILYLLLHSRLFIINIPTTRSRDVGRCKANKGLVSPEGTPRTVRDIFSAPGDIRVIYWTEAAIWGAACVMHMHWSSINVQVWVGFLHRWRERANDAGGINLHIAQWWFYNGQFLVCIMIQLCGRHLSYQSHIHPPCCSDLSFWWSGGFVWAQQQIGIIVICIALKYNWKPDHVGLKSHQNM